MSPARRATLVAGAVMLVLAGWLAWGWFRDSALVQVHHVQVSGIAGQDAPQIRRALRRAGLGMTTLHVRTDDLRRATSPYPSVRSLSVSTGFPSTLRIDVEQREAVAVLTGGQRRVAVAADGTLLPGDDTTRVPALPPGAIPKDGKLTGRTRLLASILGGAPRALRPMLDRVWTASDGVRIGLRAGPVIRFGSILRVRAKWAAVTRLLAARSTVGAKTIDVRLPERPAASFQDTAAPIADAAVQTTQQQAIAAPAATAQPAMTAQPAATAQPGTTQPVVTGTNPQP